VAWSRVSREELALGRRVVVKVLHPTRRRRQLRAFQREYSSPRDCNTDIVPVFTAGETSGPPYTMPFVEGSRCGCVCGTGAMPLLVAVSISGRRARVESRTPGECTGTSSPTTSVTDNTAPSRTLESPQALIVPRGDERCAETERALRSAPAVHGTRTGGADAGEAIASTCTRSVRCYEMSRGTAFVGRPRRR